VRLAREEGGRILAGGQPVQLAGRLAGGSFYAPTVIDGLESTCRAATEEIFGPVITLHPFDTDAQALAMANGVEYGLCAMIWTSDLARAHRMAAAIDTGMVWVNTWLMRDLRTPFGGTKRSGVGREGGDWSLDFFSEVKNVCINLGDSQ
jgi:aminomuconate-semialdehyde/2-hydroxymuconate-6-semialdehyde dehydrogenase